jgi:hypothetical protein
MLPARAEDCILKHVLDQLWASGDGGPEAGDFAHLRVFVCSSDHRSVAVAA